MLPSTLLNDTLIFLCGKSFYRSTGVRSPRTLTDVLRRARHFSKQALDPLCAYRSDFSWALSRPIRFVFMRQTNALFYYDDCFKRAISRLCNSTKLSHLALHKSTSTELSVSFVFSIKKALYKSRWMRNSPKSFQRSDSCFLVYSPVK